MKKDGKGGANTNKTGLRFEDETELSVVIADSSNYILKEIKFNDKRSIRGFEVYRNSSEGEVLVGKLMPKTRFYDFLLELEVTNTNSKFWQPDEVFINYENSTVYIVEKKWQETEGSVDEKLLGLGNKRRLYQRLLDKSEPPFAVQFIFLGNSNFFNKPRYRDTFEILRGDGVKVMLDEYDLIYFGLY